MRCRTLATRLLSSSRPCLASRTAPQPAQPLPPPRPTRASPPLASSAAASSAAVAERVQQPQSPPQSPQQQQQQQQQQSQQMYFLVKNEEAVPCSMPSGPWLEAAPRGAYTTARTCNGDSVFELSFHLDRLASSARLMIEADAAAATPRTAARLASSAAAAADPAALRPRVLAAMRAAVRGYRAAGGDAGGELKLTVLVTWQGSTQHEAPADGAAADVYVHVSPLPPRPAAPVRVVMRGAPRQNAAAKDSEWVRQRKALERGLPPGVNEVLLVDACGSLYEGLSSNFFAVVGGKVYTAGDGVLAGTVRDVTLKVAAREGIPVVLEPPRILDLAAWEGCFITSTSRLLLPVDEATPMLDSADADARQQQQEQQPSACPLPQQPQAGGLQARRFERGGLVARLEQLVLAEIQAASEPLFD